MKASSWGRVVLFLQLLCLIALLAWPCPGCASYHPDWPAIATEVDPDGGGVRAYAPGGSREITYRQELEAGRIKTLLFDDDADGKPDQAVDLLDGHPERPHFVVILDGVPFDVVQAMYDEGHFRLFPPPSRVVSVFPAMTDVALSKVFHTKPCVAAEALYFDREKNGMSDGNAVYFSGENAPWIPFVDYCAPQRVAVGAYLNPPSVFSQELRSMVRLFASTQAAKAAAYSVGTAGLGTRGGEQAIRAYLLDVERLCERITYDRRGKVRFSILADHGQTLERCSLANFEQALEKGGFRCTKRLESPNDVVIVAYGLITCAVLHTDQPEAVADVLVDHPAVDLICYKKADSVVVRKGDQQATIRKGDGGYRYQAVAGDPLELDPIIAELRGLGAVNEQGEIADRPFFHATATHHYPDPLHRIWTCFDGLVTRQGDVMLSLKPDACHGRKFFHAFVGPVASTHGGLDYLGSVTFLLSNATAAPLPPVMRSEDVLKAIGWPLDKQTPSGASDAGERSTQISRPSDYGA